MMNGSDFLITCPSKGQDLLYNPPRLVGSYSSASGRKQPVCYDSKGTGADPLGSIPQDLDVLGLVGFIGTVSLRC